RGAIDFLPGFLAVGAEEVAAARAAIDAGIVGAGRQRAVLAERTRRAQKPAARAGDHLVGRGEVLPGEVRDRAHALGDRLVLQVDAVDAAEDLVAALLVAVEAPVVALVHGHAPAAEPVGRVGQHPDAAAAGAADRRAVLVPGLRQGLRRLRLLPEDEDQNGVADFARHPGVRRPRLHEGAAGRLPRPGATDIGEKRVGLA